jgi:hypothetical protein
MSVELFRAQSDAEREELFRFRYSIYVEEMGRYGRVADHDGRLVEPELLLKISRMLCGRLIKANAAPET